MLRSSKPAIARIASLGAILAFAIWTTSHAGETRWPGETLDGRSCSEFAWNHGYGPYDYTNPRHREEKLPVVENNHFTDRVRALRSGENAQRPLNDLEYTIGAFPNHHQALYSLIRYATEDAYVNERREAWQAAPRGNRARPPTECYLQRAINFAPDDHRTYVLYGLFLHRKDALEPAHTAYETALRLEPDSTETHYNFGLLLLDMGRYNEAVEHARAAYKQGYPLQGLRQRLSEKGYRIGS